MAGLAAVALEGVLRSHVGQAPIPEGVGLYQALVTTYRVAVVLDDEDVEGAALWLRKEGLRDYVLLHTRRELDDRAAQYRRLRAQGPVELIVDPDPAATAEAMYMGVTAMFFGHPRVQRPEFRPDYSAPPRPWRLLVSEVEKQRMVDP